jgi:hypothetical protein
MSNIVNIKELSIAFNEGHRDGPKEIDTRPEAVLPTSPGVERPSHKETVSSRPGTNGL